MFTIMENRKRPRFEMLNIDNVNCNEAMEGVASSTTSLGSATLATIGGQSFILSNAANSSIPANILLSICDDDSDESEEYILDHSLLTSAKQEQTVATQTTNIETTIQQSNLVTTAPQYRIISQGKPINTNSLNSAAINSNAVNVRNSLISNSLNFPSGCEIYVIKEVFDTPNQIVTQSTATSNKSPTSMSSNSATIKVEPILSLPVQRHSTFNGKKTPNQNSNSTININNASRVIPNVTTTCDETDKRSLILEAYKKRDDKRRATHNEVERRRRDKINSWIFKLKEMLPTDVTTCNVNYSSSSSPNNQNAFATTTTRTPSNDSKSQILIKACEYIKSMKEEISSLRECLTENENLRLKNQRLQDEINSLRSRQQQQLKQHNNSNILFTTNTTSNSSNNCDNSDNCEITLNSLNATYANVHLFAPTTNHHHLSDLVGLTTNSNATISTPASVNVTYAKRELIITDYVD